MASNLRVDQILPSVGTNVAIGTATGTVTLAGTTSGTFSGNLTGNVSGGTLTGISTLGVTTAYINTLSGISTISASGSVSINQNLVFASGKGIDFSATANSSGTMTSELLADYEEGSWTPANSVTTLTNGATATYTKVGRFVYVNFDFTLATNASGSAIGITGLPFTAGSQCFGVIMSDNFNILNAFPFVASGSTTMQFQFSATSGGSRDSVAYSRIVSGGVVRGSLCYIV
jgi:hypothetical protein